MLRPHIEYFGHPSHNNEKGPEIVSQKQTKNANYSQMIFRFRSHQILPVGFCLIFLRFTQGISEGCLGKERTNHNVRQEAEDNFDAMTQMIIEQDRVEILVHVAPLEQ